VTTSSAAALLQELVAIPSVSSLSNRPLIEWIQKFLLPLGWHQRLLSYKDTAGIEKVNLVVSAQPLSEGTIDAELAIVCHTDTVPYSAAWSDATNLIERNGMLHGCGACDVKGFLACILATAPTIDISKLRHQLCLVFTSDEEIGCRGARFLFEQKALHARYAIVGEPTSLVPAHAGKGYCLANVSVKGKAAHSAFPEAGRSAIFAAARLLKEIETMTEELKLEQNKSFSPPWTTLNVGEIRGGTAKNVIPAECSFLLEWRPIPEQQPDHVLDRLRKIVNRMSADGVETEIEVLRMDSGFETSAESAVIQSVRIRPDTAINTISFGTEAPWLARMGAEVVVIGPGSMLTAHSPRECVPAAELDDCVNILRTAIEHFCG
jgi:acetylornithine deacetylase